MVLGFTVVENDENELIPTRLVTGWRAILMVYDAIINDMIEKDGSLHGTTFQPLGILRRKLPSLCVDKMLKRIKVDKAKVDVIAKLPHPTTIKGVQSFLCHAKIRGYSPYSHAHITPISGQVDVSNRGLKRILKRTVGENRASWSDKLGDALWAFLEEVDTFLVPEDSIPPGIESDLDSEGDIVLLDNLLNDDPILEFERFTFDIEPDVPVINNFDELNEDECFDLGGGEIDVSQNIEDDDSFAFDCPDFEDSRARCFVHRSLALQSFACLYWESDILNLID
ncbi:hypothetical protein Tco_1228751 [Tanacetum coccineum]